MAEVFGVVSGAIADGIKKLADFCQAVKDAPIDLRDSLSELIDLAELYKEIGQQLQVRQHTSTVGWPSKTILDRLLERSKRNLKDLQISTTDRRTLDSIDHRQLIDAASDL
ncbi:hypothetical protein E4T47_04227 [Aureobasidium subglaciale]|nr:hypothetical protein E4T47_04227 [Aureobasidium subglaciale]